VENIQIGDNHDRSSKKGYFYLYKKGWVFSAIVINVFRNKRSGPGGSTRRLHQ